MTRIKTADTKMLTVNNGKFNLVKQFARENRDILGKGLRKKDVLTLVKSIQVSNGSATIRLTDAFAKENRVAYSRMIKGGFEDGLNVSGRLKSIAKVSDIKVLPWFSAEINEYFTDKPEALFQYASIALKNRVPNALVASMLKMFLNSSSDNAGQAEKALPEAVDAMLKQFHPYLAANLLKKIDNSVKEYSFSTIESMPRVISATEGIMDKDDLLQALGRIQKRAMGHASSANDGFAFMAENCRDFCSSADLRELAVEIAGMTPGNFLSSAYCSVPAAFRAGLSKKMILSAFEAINANTAGAALDPFIPLPSVFDQLNGKRSPSLIFVLITGVSKAAGWGSAKAFPVLPSAADAGHEVFDIVKLFEKVTAATGDMNRRAYNVMPYAFNTKMSPDQIVEYLSLMPVIRDMHINTHRHMSAATIERLFKEFLLQHGSDAPAALMNYLKD